MYEKNLYSNPEKFNLRVLTTADGGGSYEFAMVVVWQHVLTGDLFYGSDSGCSCPVPFEGHTLDDLQPLTRANMQDWIDAVIAHRDSPATEVVGHALS